MRKFTYADVNTLGAILATAADAHIVPSPGRLGPHGIWAKGPADIAADANVATEREITAELRSHFQNAVIVGKKSAERDPAWRRRVTDADLAFVVDRRK